MAACDDGIAGINGLMHTSPGEGVPVQVDKEEVVDLLRARGDHDKAASVSCALPRHVDTEADAGLLHQFDVSVSEIAEVVADVERDSDQT